MEDFLFANMVSKAEYVEEAMPRRGMRQPLSRTQRRPGVGDRGDNRRDTDFRTTCPIHDLAEKYRELCGPDVEGETVTTHAFREDPAPELSRAATREELLKLLFFTTEVLVRGSPLHSSKGLDFPVVLLYLPSLPTGGEYDEKSTDSQARNLIYVAMTWAMDNLNVFVMEGCKGEGGGDNEQDGGGVSRTVKCTGGNLGTSTGPVRRLRATATGPKEPAR